MKALFSRSHSLLILFLGLVILCIVAFIGGAREEATFAMNAFGSIAVVLAVSTALYGDIVRDAVQPVRLFLDVPPVTNTMLDFTEFDGKHRIPKALLDNESGVMLNRPYAVYCLHLRVCDKVGQRLIKDCRVWLTRVLNVDTNGEMSEPYQFAVPRLMTWAPADYSPESRTFRQHQVFDFGLFYLEKNAFAVTVRQGGNWDCSFGAPEIRRFVFRIEREGIIELKEHIVDVSFVLCDRTDIWPCTYRPVLTTHS